MAYETLVVAFRNADHATAAIRALREIGIPPSDIKRHPAAANTSADVAAAAVSQPTHTTFWSWLFGREAEEQQVKLYQRALQDGGTVVSVWILEDELDRVRDLISVFGPLDVKETTSKL